LSPSKLGRCSLAWGPNRGALGLAPAPLGTGALLASGVILTCSSPPPGSSGTSSPPAPTSGSGGTTSVSDLWDSFSVGSGAGGSTSGSTGGLSTNGPALSSQYTGGSGVGGQGNGTVGPLTNAELWRLYWSGAGAGSSSGPTNGSLANDPTISAKYTGGSGGGLVFFVTGATGADAATSGSQQGSTGSTTLTLADGQSSVTTTPLVYRPGSDAGPGVVTAVWTGGEEDVQFVLAADTGTDGKTTSKSGGSLIATMGDLADDAGSYVGRSSKSLILGDWTDEKPTELSIGAGIGLGVLGVDLPLDIRDLSHTLTHREWSYKWGETLAYNTIGLIPLIGVIKNLKNAKKLKYLDDAGELAKRSDDAADAAGDAGRRAAPASDPPSQPPSNPPPDSPSAQSPDTPSPSNSHDGYSGRVGFELKNHPSQPIRNAPATIYDRQFSGHALDQMQNRGIPPSVVDNTIKHGTPFNGNRPGTQGYFDPTNRVTVIINSDTGTVITVIPGVR